MADAAISSVVKLLGPVMIQKVKSLHGVEAKVERLRNELERMQAFLVDANKKQYEDESVQQWISAVRELAHGAQDTIELFIDNVENKRNEGLLKRCTNFPKCVKHLNSIGDEIDRILQNLEGINRSRVTYGIKGLEESAASAATQFSNVEWQRRKAIDDLPVGLEDDVRKLLQESILDKKIGLSIAVVEGMGGIGKSTLARKIYKHLDVRTEFDCYAWVVVSREFTPQETIKQLLNELTPKRDKEKLREDIKKLEESTKDNHYLLQMLQQMLQERLQDISYFIVLDDIWEENHWKSLRNAFPTSVQGKRSRLLITSRNSSMTNYGQYAHKMKTLDDKKSWELMEKKTFVHGKFPEHLQSVGTQILKICDGLPLAITTVGGLLEGNTSKNTWEHILKEIKILLPKLKNNVYSILELSYQNLSTQLKSCFLCLAFFKENSSISVRRLIHIWVRQGLIHQEGEARLEEIAQGYLYELINLNMVEVKDFTLGTRVKNCQVHDLVYEVCLRKANTEIGLEILMAKEQTVSPSTKSSSRKPRHCVAYGENLGCLSLEGKKHLCSLFIVDEYNVITHKSHYWKSFQHLKILDLDDFKMKRLPQSFRALVRLKYLRIHSKYVLHLPRWFEDLDKLEFIDMGDTYVRLPKGLKMKSLRYFSANIQSGMIRIEEWENIETLRIIRLNLWMRFSSKLTDSCLIRDLSITLGKAKSYKSSKVQASLAKMKNLVKLHLSWPYQEMPTDLNLIIPQVGSLTKLKLRGTMNKFPGATVFPPTLSHLTLNLCDLKEDPMEELGKLPKLIFLKLSKRSYEGEMMKVLHGGFPSLEALSLYSLRLKCIDIEEGGMPHLRNLRVRQCNHLNTSNLPERITISNIVSEEGQWCYT